MTEPSNNPSDKPEAGAANPGSRGALIERPNQLPSTSLHQHEMYGVPEARANRLREYWDIILRRRWTVLTCFAIVLVAVMTATFLTTKIYRATLTLQIEQQESKTQVLGAAAAPNEMAFFDSQSFYQTQYELLKSDALAQRVIEQLNLVVPSQAADEKQELAGYFQEGR